MKNNKEALLLGKFMKGLVILAWLVIKGEADDALPMPIVNMTSVGYLLLSYSIHYLSHVLGGRGTLDRYFRLSHVISLFWINSNIMFSAKNKGEKKYFSRNWWLRLDMNEIKRHLQRNKMLMPIFNEF